jgi:hypothetical protein
VGPRAGLDTLVKRKSARRKLKEKYGEEVKA